MGDDYATLLANKAEKLAALNKMKPGQKHFKRTLRTFLEADAAAERVMIARIEAKTRKEAAEERSFEPTPEIPAGVTS